MHILLRVGLRLRDRLLDVQTFRHADADAALLIADHDRDAETETLASGNDAGNAAHIKHAFFEFLAHHRALAILGG